MGALVLNRAFLPRASTRGVSCSRNCISETSTFLVASRKSCLSRRLAWPFPQHRGFYGLNNVDGRPPCAGSRGGSALICRADLKHVEPPDSDSRKDFRNGAAVARLIGPIGDFINANFLLVALISSMALGLAWPAPGQAARQLGLTNWCTGAIFVLSGLNLRSGDTDKALAAWQVGLFGLVSILLITPFAAFPILSIRSSPRELITGLAIFACVPTTLSSAVSLTQIAGANATLALGMTVLSNLISIFTMPFTLTMLVGRGIGISVPPGPLLRSLVETLLLPLLLGKVLRESFSGLAKLVDGNRRQVSMLSTLILSLVPWMQLSTSKNQLLQIDPFSLLTIIAAGLGLHIAYLTVNSVVMKIWPSSAMKIDYNSRAVLLVSSQKSIIVAIAVISRLGGAFGDAGLLVLPCIAAQLSQVFIDSILVNKWLQKTSRLQGEIKASQA